MIYRRWKIGEYSILLVKNSLFLEIVVEKISFIYSSGGISERVKGEINVFPLVFGLK